jgi:predicted transcriptional regulator
MEVHLPPDVAAKLDALATLTGRAPEELVRDAVSGYVDDLAEVRASLDSRYDDLRSGLVQPIDGEEAFAVLRAKCEASRARRP